MSLPLSRSAQILCVGLLCLLAQMPGKAHSGPPKPATVERRELTAADARRVAELEAQANKLEQAGEYAEAQASAQQILEVRTRVQGGEHWQTADARRRHQSLEQLAALTPEARADFASAAKLAIKGGELIQRGRYGEAEPLLRDALATCRRVVGEDHLGTATSYNNLAVDLQAQGKYAEARPLYEKALEIRRQALGEGHPDTAGSYNDLATNLQAQGQYAEAEPLLQKALQVRRRALGDRHSDTASSYNGLAENLNARGRYAEAAPLYEKALEIRRQALGEDHPDTAMSYNNLAYNLHVLGRHDEVEPLLRNVLEICRRSLGEDHPKTGMAYNNLACNLKARGKYAEAQLLHEKGLAIRVRSLGEDHPDTAQSYDNLATVLDAQGKYAEAEPLHEKALAIYRRSLGEDHTDTAQSYSNLATNLAAQGKYAQAEPLYEKALAICRRKLGEGHPQTARSYNGLAFNLNARGLYAEASPLYEKAIVIHRRVQGEDHPDTATGYNNLAGNLRAQGKYAEAEPPVRKALAICRRVLGEDHPKTSLSYNNLASILYDQRRHVEAQPLYEKVLEICRRVLGEGHPEMARSYNNLATNLQAQGKYAEAEPPLREALKIWRRVFGEDHPDTATGYNNLAGNLLVRGRLAEADSPFREALAISRRVLGEGHPLTVNRVHNLAGCLHARGRYAEAEATWAEAARGFEAARRPIGHTGLERAAFMAERTPLSGLAAVRARFGRRVAAWQALEAEFGRGLFDDLARPLEPDERRREQDLLARLQRLDEQVAALAPAARGDGAHREQLEALRERREALKAELAEFEAGVESKYGAAAGRPYDLARIQDHLPPDAALVAWLDFKALPEAADSDGEHWACLVRQRGVPVWVKLTGSGPQGRWTEADDRLPEQVRAALASQAQAHSSSWREPTARLAEQRLAPLDRHLKANDGLPPVRRLIVLPSRWLMGVPIEALIEARPQGTPRYTVGYAPSGTLFAWLRERKDGRGRTGAPRLLALGDPAFTKGLDQLPGTRTEARAIAHLFDSPPREVLLGSQASEQALDALARSDQIRKYSILHLATHGLMDPDVVMRSRLFLAQDQLPDPAKAVLAGQEVYDGELTAEQILRTWRLDADLVTLSACQTGLGKVSGGEGYLGFSQALLLAGARSLVLSLWKVNDEATSLLMVRFYANLLGQREGLGGPMPKAEALREAKQWLRGLTDDQAKEANAWVRQLASDWDDKVELAARERGRKRPLLTPTLPARLSESKASDPAASRPYVHPYFWAGFILIGDPD